MTWIVEYLLCGKFQSRAVVAPDEVRAWIVIYRSHYCTPHLLEVRRVG